MLVFNTRRSDERFVERERCSAIRGMNDNVRSRKFHRFAGESDNALDEEDGGVFGVAHDDDVAAFRRFKIVRQLIGDEVVARFEGAFHRRAVHQKRFRDEETNRNDNNQSNDGERDDFFELVLPFGFHYAALYVFDVLRAIVKTCCNTFLRSAQCSVLRKNSFCIFLLYTEYRALSTVRMHIVVGLGNPGEEYALSRHNTGRMALDAFRKKYSFSDWEVDKKLNAHVSEGKVGKEKALLITPDTFMNNSGKAVAKLIGSKKAAAKLLVVYDDLDLPFGTMKISFGRSSGGHNGLESIIRAVKTRDFPRLRLGVSPATPSGKLKKPAGEKKVLDFLLGDFSKKEREALPKFFKEAGEAVAVAVEEGYQIGMNRFN